MHRLIVVVGILFSVLIAGCGLLADLADEQEGTLPPATSSPAQVETPAPVETTLPPATVDFTQPVSPTTSPTPQSPLPLRIWLPPEIAVRTDEGAEVLVSQLETFNGLHPNLEIIVEQKAASGQGSILSYLRTGHNVAPSILPDLIALPIELLPEAAAQELIIPLNPYLSPEMTDSLFPAAKQMGVVNEQMFGYPFALTNLTHLVYNQSVITDTLPLQWSEFVSDTQKTLTYPGEGRLSSFLGLQFYLAAGGRLFNEAGQPDLQLDALTRAFTQLSLGRTVLAPSVGVDTQDTAWQLYESGGASSVWVTADFFLGRPFVSPNSAFSAMPGPEGALTPFTNGWVWLISTPDPARRGLAAELLAFLVEPENLGQWSRASNILPARRDALATWSLDGDYLDFIGDQLEAAQAFPVSLNSELMNVLGTAVQELLSTSTSPQVIAEEAIATLRQ